jgi:predicted transcriptional regulator
MRKRGWADISITILESAITPENKTRLMYKSNLNFAQFDAYFHDFLQKGLLEETVADGNGPYVTSERGKTLLAALKTGEKLFSEAPAQPLLVLS